MKKTGKIISFPKSRRSEQTGLTHKGFPVKWLGLLLMTTVGGAWAVSPGTDEEVIPSGPRQVQEVVFEGEPQVVAQLMGAVVGAEGVPTGELRALSIRGSSDRRVVVGPKDKAEAPRRDQIAPFLAGVEKLESELADSGRYPAIPSSDAGVKEAGYRTTGERFKLESDHFFYDSSAGFQVVEEAQSGGTNYKVAGFLQNVTSGWGPWKRDGQEFATQAGGKHSLYDWLEGAPVTPSWSARMYFPVDRETTGYAFRRGDGTTPYCSGEVLYDAVTGTFQLKLYRTETSEMQPMDSVKLEALLDHTAAGCELVGEAALLSDLGLLSRPEEGASVVRISTPVRLPLSADDALDGLALSTFSRHQTSFQGGEYRAHQDATSSVSVVGRINISDKLGQVHQMRVRAGRASDYDWVVGQLCPVGEGSDVAVTDAYDDAFGRKTESTVIAGE